MKTFICLCVSFKSVWFSLQMQFVITYIHKNNQCSWFFFYNCVHSDEFLPNSINIKIHDISMQGSTFFSNKKQQIIRSWIPILSGNVPLPWSLYLRNKSFKLFFFFFFLLVENKLSMRLLWVFKQNSLRFLPKGFNWLVFLVWFKREKRKKESKVILLFYFIKWILWKNIRYYPNSLTPWPQSWDLKFTWVCVIITDIFNKVQN